VRTRVLVPEVGLEPTGPSGRTRSQAERKELTVPVRGGFEADDGRALGDATYADLGIGSRPPVGARARYERGVSSASFCVTASSRSSSRR
jgi:hypothetical protein